MLRQIGNQFRKPSGFLGRIISFLMKKGNVHAYLKIIPLLNIKKGDHILEIGYGHGIGIEMISKNHDCIVTGVDFSELMFHESQTRNKKHIQENKVKLDYGDYLELPFPPESFDQIFFINVIYFWDNIQAAFQKIKKELKPNGSFCFYMVKPEDLRKMKFTLDDIFHKYEIDFVVKELEQAGFKNIEYQFDIGYFVKCTK